MGPSLGTSGGWLCRSNSLFSLQGTDLLDEYLDLSGEIIDLLGQGDELICVPARGSCTFSASTPRACSYSQRRHTHPDTDFPPCCQDSLLLQASNAIQLTGLRIGRIGKFLKLGAWTGGFKCFVPNLPGSFPGIAADADGCQVDGMPELMCTPPLSPASVSGRRTYLLILSGCGSFPSRSLS